MKRLILIRSGNTAWDEENRVQGTVPLPLSQVGKVRLQEQAEELASEGVDCIYSSGNESAGPTASYLARYCHVKAKKIASLHELDCGMWQGLRVEELEKRFRRVYRQWCEDPTSVCPPCGETVEAAFDRVKDGLRILEKKSHGKVVALIAAPVVASLVECALKGVGPDQLWEVMDGACGVSVFENKGQEVGGLGWVCLRRSGQDNRMALGRCCCGAVGVRRDKVKVSG